MIHALPKGSSKFKLDLALVIPIIVFLPFHFNDFDGLLAGPRGRLGAARPPAEGEDNPEESSP